MTLTDAKIKIIQDFISTMQQAQVEQGDPKNGYQARPALMAAYAGMMSVSQQELAEFNARFPETPIGVSGL